VLSPLHRRQCSNIYREVATRQPEQPDLADLSRDPAPLSPELRAARGILLDQIVAFAATDDDAWKASLKARIEDVLDAAGPAALAALRDKLFVTGKDWAYYPPNPLAQSIQRSMADLAVTVDSELRGAEHLTAIRGRPALLVLNHLSYADANLLSVLLTRSGHGELSDRLTVIAGPKVYSDPVRLFSSLCFGTIKTPQSSALSTEGAVMSVREVARVARATIGHARERLEAGDALLVFVEGTRSRTGGMQRTLAAIARYFDLPELPIVPIAITGSDRFLSVSDSRFHVTKVTVTVGRPGEASHLHDLTGSNKRLAMDAIGIAIARLLPPEQRGEYGDDTPDLDEARSVATRVFG